MSVNIKKWINIDSLRGGNSRECQIKGAIISYIHVHYHYYHHHHLHHRHWHHWQLCCENLGSVWGVAIPASECAPTVLHRIIGSCVLRTVQSMSIVQFCAGLFGFGPQFNQVVEDSTTWFRLMSPFYQIMRAVPSSSHEPYSMCTRLLRAVLCEMRLFGSMLHCFRLFRFDFILLRFFVSLYFSELFSDWDKCCLYHYLE